MNNAQAIFNGINTSSEIQKLLGRQEDIFLDFKERGPRWRSPDQLSDDEKQLFSKAASGFAHQEGGVLVWGIEAKPGKDGMDQAKALRPFPNVKQFKQALEEQIKYATEPIVDGIRHKAIFVNDEEARNEGFVVSYFPKSGRVHRALAKTPSDFYKRHGDSFTPLSTEEIRSLFFRTLAPELELVVERMPPRIGGPHSSTYDFTFAIRNKGVGIGKFVSTYVGVADLTDIINLTYFSNSPPYALGRLLDAPEFFQYGKHFILDGTIVIYPNEVMRLFSGNVTVSSQKLPPAIKFKIFAEGMPPVEDEV